MDEITDKESTVENPEPKKASDKSFVWAIIIIVLLLSALFGLRYVLKEETPLTLDQMYSLCLEGDLDDEICYVHNNVYVFVKLEGLWYTTVWGKDVKVGVPLHFHPGELKDIPIKGSYNHSLFNQTPHFFITFDPIGIQLQYVALAIGEFDRNMLAAFDKLPIAACLINETTACHDRPIINCTNTKEPVVYMKQEGDTSIILDDNCITIQGEGLDLIKATDLMLLSFYNII